MNASPTHQHRAGIVLILLVLLLTVFARSSFAAANSYSGLTQAQSIINNTGPLNLMNSQSGLVINAANDAKVVTSVGRTVTLPVSAAVLVDRKAMAVTAAKIIRGANVIGAAFTAYEVYTFVKESGVTTCPPPAFFCKPGAPAASTPPTGGSVLVGNGRVRFNTDAEGFAYIQNVYAGSYPPAQFYWDEVNEGGGTMAYWVHARNDPSWPSGMYGNRQSFSVVENPGTCAPPATLQNGACVGGASEPVATTSEQELADTIASASGWPTADTVRAYNAIRHDAASLNIPATDLLPGNAPVTVTAPEVATAPAVVKTQQIVQPDGSTVTRETSEQITVIPNIPWKTLDDAKKAEATMQEKKTTTVTDIQPDGTRKPVSTTINTPQTISQSGDTTKAPSDAGPKECGSPGHPKCAIDEEGTPDAKDFDKDKDLKTIQDANDAAKVEYDKIGGGGGGGGGGSSGIHKDWFPQIPTTACENPKVTVPITGAQKEVDICTPVGYFRSVFAVVFAFFCIFGSVRQIEAAIKA
jgi:hypothetical protein